MIEKPLFCDLVKERRFTQIEIDWRSVNSPSNLRKDYEQNLAYERECEEVE